MYLLQIFINHTNPVEKELPRAGLQVDPRPIDAVRDQLTAFQITYKNNGKVVIIKRIKGICTDHDSGSGVDYNDDFDWKFRVYDPATEVVPRFDSTIYTYLGVEGETAPCNTVVGIIGPSVKVIREYAFGGCDKMIVCSMHDDNVETIEKNAFFGCTAMKKIRLSRTLKHIGIRAFGDCNSLDALFIPPSVERIGSSACYYCENIRILSLPPNISTWQIGAMILQGCGTFFRATQIQQEGYGRVVSQVSLGDESHPLETNSMENVNQSILDFYHNLPPLYKACLDTNVSARTIHVCVSAHGSAAAFATDHNDMTPLHILATNPYSTVGSILSCLHLNISASLLEDDADMTPIDYLWKYDNVEGLVSVVLALCLHREANEVVRSGHDIYEDSHNQTKRRIIIT